MNWARGTRKEPQSHDPSVNVPFPQVFLPLLYLDARRNITYHVRYTCPMQASLRLFNPREFNQLLSGAAADGPGGGGAAALDVADMRRWARYSGGYRCAP